MTKAKDKFYSKGILLRGATVNFHSLFRKATHPKFPESAGKFYVTVSLDKEENKVQIDTLNLEIQKLLKSVFGDKIPSYKNHVIEDGDSDDLSENAAKYSAGKWIIKAKSLNSVPIHYKGLHDHFVKEDENLIKAGCIIDLVIKIMLYDANSKSGRGITAFIEMVDYRKPSSYFTQTDYSHLLVKADEADEIGQVYIPPVNNSDPFEIEDDIF